jgi:hypothetical protein
MARVWLLLGTVKVSNLVKQGAIVAQTFKRRNSASILGFRLLKSAMGGIIPFSRTMTVLIKPAIPAHPSK